MMQSRAVFTTVPDGVLEPPMVENDPYASLRPITVIERFQAIVEKHGSENAMALKRPVNKAVPDKWTFWSWSQYYEQCRDFAKSLMHLRCAPFTVVNAIGFNSPEWFIANNGAQLAACIAAGIYTTNLPDACLYISEHSKAEVVVCEGNEQLAKYAKISARLPYLKAIVVWGEPIDASLAKQCGGAVYSWEKFLALGGSVSDAELEERQFMVGPGNCSTLIYTSGTTGKPKAVMVSHDNVTWTTSMMTDNYLDLTHKDRIVSYLPLSHIAAQIIDIHIPMLKGCCTYFCQPDAMKGTLTVTMKDVKPTFFFGVPRVWEKIQEKMAAIGRESTGVKKALGAWAKKLATEKNERAQYGADGGAPMCFGCANAVVLTKVKEKLGLDQCRGCFTGAAPISKETLWYFASLNIPIYEVFGQSECSGPHTINDPNNWKLGSCGRPLVGTESKIANGELCYRGRHIFMGYMYMEEQTRETIDAEGYLHSGDIAEFDSDTDKRILNGPGGFMKITGRKKELIITAGGENIPPVLIETEMKSRMLAVSNCMVVGDRRKYLTMLVSLKTDTDPSTGEPTSNLAADALHEGNRIGSSARTVEEAIVDPLWMTYVDDGRKATNQATTSNAQKVQKFAMLPTDFSLGSGTLTPTMKLKRSVANSMYADLIESMY